jgi:sugar lactone lactonase YvrE
VIIDQQNDSLIICDFNNRRVVQWIRRNGTNEEIIISNIDCVHLIMNNGYLYVSNCEKHEVRRWKMRETEGTIVAGGNGQGHRLDKLDTPISPPDQDAILKISLVELSRLMRL